MIDFITTSISYAIIQSSAIFLAISIFALVTKKYYDNKNISKIKRLINYGLIGATFGLISFFAFEKFTFLGIGLLRTAGLFIIMFIYSSVVISPFVYFYKKKESK